MEERQNLIQTSYYQGEEILCCILKAQLAMLNIFTVFLGSIP